MYAGTNRTVINGKALAMKKMNPNLKIFAFMTDPASRLFSHLNMCIRSRWKFCKQQTLEQVMNKSGFQIDAFLLAWDWLIPQLALFDWLRVPFSEHQIENSSKITKYLANHNSTDFVETEEMEFGSFYRFIQSGNYALVTGIYQKHFGENVHFVDGLNLLRIGTQIHHLHPYL